MDTQHADARETLAYNRDRLVSLMGEWASGTVTLALERFAYDRATEANMPYEGDDGVGALLDGLGGVWPGGKLVHEGYTVGVAGRVFAPDGQPLNARITLGPAAQLITQVGPTPSASDALEVIRALDKQMHLTALRLGRDLSPVAQGCDPHVTNPAQASLVPLSRHALVAAHLSRVGSTSRDVMRATATSRVTVAVPPSELVETLRLATALAPVLAFLTDNSLKVRDVSPLETPSMPRTRLVDGLYPLESRMVRGLFRTSFDLSDYVSWLERQQPMFFTPAGGTAAPTGERTCRELMEERRLQPSELLQILRSGHAEARIMRSGIELRCADALQPRLACAYAALVRGMLGTREGRASLASGIHLDVFFDDDPFKALEALEENGWEAKVYGIELDRFARGMIRAALRQTSDESDKELLGELAELWSVRATPRDLLVSNWKFETGYQDEGE